VAASVTGVVVTALGEGIQWLLEVAPRPLLAEVTLMAVAATARGEGCLLLLPGAAGTPLQLEEALATLMAAVARCWHLVAGACLRLGGADESVVVVGPLGVEVLEAVVESQLLVVVVWPEVAGTGRVEAFRQVAGAGVWVVVGGSVVAVRRVVVIARLMVGRVLPLAAVAG
jgi:hypothetical protein